MIKASVLPLALALCVSSHAAAAIVLVSQNRTVTIGGGFSAPDFGPWNRAVSGSVTGVNPPVGPVGSYSASQNTQAITPAFMGGQLGVSFTALRVGNGGPMQSRFETVFDVVGSPSPVRVAYLGVNTGAAGFFRTIQLELAGPVTYLRTDAGSDAMDLTLTPGRYTFTALTDRGLTTYDASFGTTLNFGLTAVPGPSVGAVLVIGIMATSVRRWRAG